MSSDGSAAAQALKAAATKFPKAAEVGPAANFLLPRGASGPPRYGMVFMHGLGDTEEGWTMALKEELTLPPLSGTWRLILPRAPLQAVTCNGGMKMTSWFDMEDFPVRASTAPPSHGCAVEEALASAARVHDAIAKLEAEGVPPERIFVGGFSQGGAMSLLSTITHPRRLGGIVVFSGVVFFGDQLKHWVPAHCKDLEVFWGHGTHDGVLDPSLQAEGVKLLEEAGLKVTAKQYPMEHSSHPKEFADVSAFLTRLVSPSEL